MSSLRLQFLNLRNLPARLTSEEAAWFLGFAPHAVPVLVAAGLLKPLGQPARNAVKYFAMPKKRWPGIKFKEKRAITLVEHQAIVEREQNPERKAFYQLAWHLGASQSDIACLEAGNIDWENHVISFARKKTGSIAIMRFDDEVAELLGSLPTDGPLFPYLRTVRAGDRATEFHQRCVGLGIKGVSLHSYRYAWAERAKTAGYPERFAQEALGHNSKAVHRAYARKAKVELPPLSEYERQRTKFAVLR